MAVIAHLAGWIGVTIRCITLGNGRASVSEDRGEITEAIDQLRAQLFVAQESGKGEGLRFQVNEVEMEFVVEVRKDGGARGGIRLGVVELGADGKLSQGNTHRLKLKLAVTGPDGKPTDISDRR